MFETPTRIQLEPHDFAIRFPSPEGWRAVWFREVPPRTDGVAALGPMLEFGVTKISAWGLRPPEIPAGESLAPGAVEPSWAGTPIPLFGRRELAMPDAVRFHRWVPPWNARPAEELVTACLAWVREGRPPVEDLGVRDLLSRLPGLAAGNLARLPTRRRTSRP